MMKRELKAFREKVREGKGEAASNNGNIAIWWNEFFSFICDYKLLLVKVNICNPIFILIYEKKEK